MLKQHHMYGIPKKSDVIDLKGDNLAQPTGINLANSHGVTHFTSPA